MKVAPFGAKLMSSSERDVLGQTVARSKSERVKREIGSKRCNDACRAVAEPRRACRAVAQRRRVTLLTPFNSCLYKIPSSCCCQDTRKVLARDSSAAMLSSAPCEPIKLGSRLCFFAARSRRCFNSCALRTIPRLGRTPERRRMTGQSLSGKLSASCAASRNARRRRAEKCL